MRTAGALLFLCLPILAGQALALAPIVARRHYDTRLSLQTNESDDSGNQRRSFLQKLTVSLSIPFFPLTINQFPAIASSIVSTPAFVPDLSWPLGKVAFSLLPLAGTYSRRATVEETIVENTIWTHDQIQGVVNVNVPVRQTVVKLHDGGLWIHNPVAPTPQLLQMVHELERQHGPVKHIVLGTVALEHKATFGPFFFTFSSRNSLDSTGTMGLSRRTTD